jgi:hypothetical protein
MLPKNDNLASLRIKCCLDANASRWRRGGKVTNSSLCAPSQCAIGPGPRRLHRVCAAHKQRRGNGARSYGSRNGGPARMPQSRLKRLTRSDRESARNAMSVSVRVTPSTPRMACATRSPSLVLPHPHHRDQIEFAGDRIDLRDAAHLTQRLGHCGGARRLGVDQDNRGDPDLIGYGDPRQGAARPSAADTRQRAGANRVRWAASAPTNRSISSSVL